jgi:hypothetical protein
MDRYIPNQIPLNERWWNFGLSVAILAWGSYGLGIDNLIVPVGRRGEAFNFHGSAAFIMFGAMVAAALNLLAVIFDHFDVRNNELAYRRIAFFTQAIGWVLSAAAVVVHIFG